MVICENDFRHPGGCGLVKDSQRRKLISPPQQRESRPKLTSRRISRERPLKERFPICRVAELPAFGKAIDFPVGKGLCLPKDADGRIGKQLQLRQKEPP